MPLARVFLPVPERCARQQRAAVTRGQACVLAPKGCLILQQLDKFTGLHLIAVVQFFHGAQLSRGRG